MIYDSSEIPETDVE
ncbi:hypothetical protein Zm00014a_038119 [Zea mays]|uniref:Uncharacterized protein n=1 Tax=Zea mays TaxID=4577 RepID=A0A3L6FQR5_MAIZE|nr:hypothetical protein Zm00014a_038119 [Zea mays]